MDGLIDDDDNEPQGPTDEQIAAVPVLEDELRKIGLYLEHHAFVIDDSGALVLIVDCLVGDVAFKTRLLDPEQHEMDKQFKKLTTGASTEFADTREQILQRLRDGKNPLKGD